MTGKELIEKLQEFDEETLNQPVKFFNPKYEDYETVREVSNMKLYPPQRRFILLNEA